MSVIGSHQAAARAGYLVLPVLVVLVALVGADKLGEPLVLREALAGESWSSSAATAAAVPEPEVGAPLQRLPGELGGTPTSELPRPANVSLVIVSWYPPLLRLTWRLEDPQEARLRLELYAKLSGPGTNPEPGHDVQHQRGRPENATTRRAPTSGPHNLLDDLERLELDDSGQRLLLADKPLRQMPELEPLRQRKMLVRKSLNCFQVTYNIVNSRFKTSEELPGHAGALHLVNLLPATEYSLQVAAVYLDGRRRLAERIQFVTPADNESRRFKDNTYRPIHRYPTSGGGGAGLGDERRGPRGLEQARLEELTIVAFALLFWVATICLFFNKWGKIRMLEPYQPAYREADSPAPPFIGVPAAHHASLHQLGAAVGGAGSGAKLASSLCVAAAAAATAGDGPTAAVLASGKLASVGSLGAGNGLLSSTGSGGSVSASLDPGPGPAPLTAAAAAAAGVKLAGPSELVGGPRRLATAWRRTDTEPLACSGELGAGKPTPRRTETELNLLFQSKAHALAKAANLWNVKQQHHQIKRQKLRQHQYRTQRIDLDTLRRTSKALLRQQGQLSFCAGFTGAGDSSPGAGASPVPPPPLPSSTGGPLQRYQQQQQTAAPSHQNERCLSVELGGSHGSTRLHQQTSSKLLERRLLFISKSHQHHHVATSASSGTLRKESSSAAAPQLTCLGSMTAQMVAQAAVAAASAGGAAALMIPSHAAATSTTKSLKPNSVSLDTPEPASGAIRRPGGARTTCEPTGGSAPQVGCSPAPPAALHHHIRIEPPSPPSSRSRRAQRPQSSALTTYGGDLLDGDSSACSSNGALHHLKDDEGAQSDEFDFCACRREAGSGGGGGDERLTWSRHRRGQTAASTGVGGTQCLDNRPSWRPAICLEPRSSTDESAPEPVDDDDPSDFRESRDAFARLRDSRRPAAHLTSGGVGGASAQLSAGGNGPRARNRSSSSSLAELAAAHLRPTASGQAARVGCSLCSGDTRGSSCAALLLAAAAGERSVAGSPRSPRPRLCSVFVGSPYAGSKRGSFAMLHALSQKKSKSAEDVAHLSSLVLEIWARVDRNPLLQSASHQQLASNPHATPASAAAAASAAGSHRRHSHKLPANSQDRHQPPRQDQHQQQRRPCSLTVAHM